MTWTYTPTAMTQRERIRDLIGDVDTTDQQVTDEQITAYLATESSEYLAGARLAGVLAAKYARLADKSIGGFRLSHSQKASTYRELAKSLAEGNALRIAASPYAVPSAGGVSLAEKLTHAGDSDINQPDFSRGMHDHPGAQTSPTRSW